MTTTDRIVGMQDDMTEELSYCNANTAPLFLNLLRLGRVRTIASSTVSWVDYSCRNTQTKIKEALTEAATTIKVENKDVFHVGALGRIGEEVIKVTAIDDTTGDMTVLRGQFGTTAEAFEIGEELFFINDNVAEGADLQGSNYKGGANYRNVTQIIREEIEVSGTAQAVKVPSGNGVDAYGLEITKALDVCIGKIEKALVSGVRFEQGKNRGMGGVKFFLKDGQNIDAGGQALTYETLNELARKVNSAGGNLAEGYAYYVSGVQSVKMSTALKDYMKVAPTDNVLGAVVSAVATPFGLIPVIVSNNLRADEIILINHEDMDIDELRALKHIYMGLVGDSTKGLVVGELTFEMRQIHKQGRITNLKK